MSAPSHAPILQRRVSARVSFTRDMFIKPIIYGDAPRDPIAVCLVDISQDGVCVQAANPFEMRTLVKLSIPVPAWERHLNTYYRYNQTSNSTPLVAIGEVVRVQEQEGGGYVIGIAFVNIDPDHKRALASSIATGL